MTLDQVIRRYGPWLAAALIVIGVVVLQQQPPQAPPPATTPTTTTQPPPLPDAPWWQTPTSQLTVDQTNGPEWVDRLIRYGSLAGDDGVLVLEFGLAPNENYSVPTYRATAETPRWKVRRKRPDQWPGFFNVGPDDLVPWDPARWRPSNGRDAYAHVIDQDGYLYGFWSLAWWSYSTDVNNVIPCTPWPGGAGANLPPPLGVGYDPNTMLCAASAFRVTDPTGKPVRFNSMRGNFPGASGGGWPVRPITPEDIEAGRVTHVAHLMTVNTGVGPECSPDDPGYGSSCITAVAPAGQYERKGQQGATSQSIPEGTRFALRMTDAEIDQWLDSKGYTGRLRETVRVIIVGLRDYGMVLGDSTAYGRSITMAGGENPDTAAKWRALGIEGDGKRLLDGLITRDRLVAFEPMTNICSGVPSRTYCWAEDVRG